MIRRACVIAILTAGVVFTTTIARALVPNPGLCDIPRPFQIHSSTALTNAVPSHAAKYNVLILSTGGPINASSVEIRMTIPGDTLTCWCDGQVGPRPYVFRERTNAAGIARFVVGGGGCIEYGLLAIPGHLDYVGEVFADGVRLQEIGLVSSDVVDNAGRRATDSPRWSPAGACAAGLADAVEHTTALSTNTYDWCTDFNCDNDAGVSDAVIVTPFLAGAAYCSGASGP